MKHDSLILTETLLLAFILLLLAVGFGLATGWQI
jgi:hypothetical protein